MTPEGLQVGLAISKLMGVAVGAHGCCRADPVESDQELREQAEAVVFT